MGIKPAKNVVASRRVVLGLTQRELADKAGVSARSVQEVEAAKTEVAIDTLRRIAKALELQYADLLDPSMKADSAQPTELRSAGRAGMLTVTIDLANPDPAAIKKAIAVLRGFLPDEGTGLAVIGVVGGSLVIGVQKTPANEAALATVSDAFDTLGAGRTVVRDMPVLEIPETITYLGDSKPVEYLAATRREFLRKHDGLTPGDLELLRDYIAGSVEYSNSVKARFPPDWALIRGECKWDPERAGPAERFSFAVSELGKLRFPFRSGMLTVDELPNDKDGRKAALWNLAVLSASEDALVKVRTILARVEGLLGV